MRPTAEMECIRTGALGGVQNPSNESSPGTCFTCLLLCISATNLAQASRGACPEPPRYSPHPPESEDRDDDPVAQATLRWVRSTVVGLNLCPWAGSALVGGRMQVVVHPPRPPLPPAGTTAAGSGDAGERHFGGSGLGEEGDGLLEGLVEFAARQAMALGGLEGEAAVNATTLVVARPPVAEDFEEFLGAVEAVDDFLDDSGLRGTVQVRKGRPDTAWWFFVDRLNRSCLMVGFGSLARRFSLFGRRRC